MKVYVYSVTLKQREYDNIEYSLVKGVYADKETAKQVAMKEIKAQSNLWEGSYTIKLSKTKIALISKTCWIKIYQIKEMKMK